MTTLLGMADNQRLGKNTLHLLNQYTKLTIQRNSESQVQSFPQRTGDGRNPLTYERDYWKYKECCSRHQKVHPPSQFPNKKNKKDDDEEKSNTSKDSKSSIKNLYKYTKKGNNTFTTLQYNMKQIK